MRLPYELIDKILTKLDDLNIAFELWRFYVVKKIYEKEKYPINLACKYGNLKLVKYLNSFKVKCSFHALYNACQFGHLDIVEYLYYGVLNNSFNFRYAIFQILVDNSNRALFHDACVIAIRYNKSKIVEFFNTKDFYSFKHQELACKYGALKVVKYFHENGKRFSTREMKLANDYGHLDVVKYLYENGVKPNNKFMTKPATYGYLEMLKYLHHIGVKPNDKAMITASKRGHLDVVKYLYSIGFKYCNKAFSLGHAMDTKYEEIIAYHQSKNKNSI